MAPLSHADGPRGQEIWGNALASMQDEDLKSQLKKAVKTQRRNILDAVLETTHERQQECVRERWKFTLSDGNEVVIRDLMQKIAGWAQQCRQWGDLTVQPDLANAAFPWAAIQFLLRAATSDAQEFGTRVYQLELIARLITRCHEYSSQHLNDRSPVGHEALEKALTQLYAEILTQLGRMANDFAGQPLVPPIKSSSRVEEDVEFPKKIFITATETFRLADWSEAETLNFFEPQVVRLCNQAGLSWQILAEERHEKLLDWLSPLPYYEHHKFISDSRATGFGEWLLNDPRYKSWHTSSSSSILSLQGVVGCGKTTLCSMIVDVLAATGMATPAPAPSAYVYCANDEIEPGRSSPDELMRTILAQLAFGRGDETKVHNVLVSAYKRRSALAQVDKLDKLKSEDCVQLLLELAEQESLTIIIDGISHIKGENSRIVIDALKSIVKNSGNVVNILVSNNNRDLPTLVPNETISITGHEVRQDMESFIHHQLDAKFAARWTQSSAWPELRGEFQQTLLDSAGERFLSVQLQIDRLSRGTAEEDIMLVSKAGLSMQLNDIYKHTLESLLDAKYTGRTTAITTFLLLLYTKEALGSSAFLSVVATRAGTLTPPQLIETCSGLIVLDTTCNTLRFINHSVKEYLETLNLFSFLPGQKFMSELCLKALSQTRPQGCPMTSATESFYAYAATYWPFHVKEIRDGEMSNDLKELVFSFVFDTNFNITSSFTTWLDSIQRLFTHFPNGNVLREALDGVTNAKEALLFVASAIGLDNILNSVLQSLMGVNASCKNHQGYTPLDVAAAFGHTLSVLALLEHDAETDAQDGRYRNVLHAACCAGHLDMVDKLLENGVSAMKRRGNVSPDALEAAFRGGREEVALRLLQDATILETTADYERVVLDAAKAGFVKVLQRLKQTDFHSLGSPDSKQDQMKAIAKRATEGGHIEVLRWCLSETAKGTAIFADDAVASAVLYGHKRVVEFFLEQGLSMEAEGKFGSPLVIASLLNHDTLVLLLLRHGVEVDADGIFGTALYIAALKAHTGIVQLLVQAGCNVNRMTGFHETALRAAAYHGHVETVKLLLSAGASIRVDGTTQNAFRAAIEGGHPEVVKLMIDQGYIEVYYAFGEGCTLSAGPSRYKALLRDASPERKRFGTMGQAYAEEPVLPPKPILELDAIFQAGRGSSLPTDALLSEPREFRRRRRRFPSNRETTLQRSVHLGNKDVIVAVLERWRVLDIRDEHVTEAAVWAAEQGLAPMVEVLLTHLATTASLHSCIQSVLKVARRHGKPNIIEVAIAIANRQCSTDQLNQLRNEALSGVEKFKRIENMSSKEVLRTFESACESADLDLLEAILESTHVSQLKADDLSYGLQLAAMSGHAAIARLFLSSGVLRCRSITSDDCLIRAVRNGHMAVTRLLVSHYEATPFDAVQLSRAFVSSCHNGHIDVVRYFVQELSIDVNEVAPDTPIEEPRMLRLARAFGGKFASRSQTHTSYISPLQSSIKGCGPRRGSRSDILDECDNGSDVASEQHEEVIKLLLDHGANPNDLGGLDIYPIQAASEFCTEAVLKLLIEAGADVKSTGSDGSAIFRAAGRELSAASVMGMLLDAGVDLPTEEAEIERIQAQPLTFFVGEVSRKHFQDTTCDPDGRFLVTKSLDYVFTHGPGAAIRILMSNFPQLRATDERYGLVLQMAVCLDDHSYVDMLLARGVDVNALGYYYGTALQAASRYGNYSMVMKLLGAGADVNVLQGRWQTALRAAIASGNAQVVRTLLGRGADTQLMFDTFKSHINARETKSPTALQLAVESGEVEIVEAILETGVDMSGDVSDESSKQSLVMEHHPLIRSSEQGNTAMVRALLHAGAPVNVTGQKMAWRACFEDEYASPLNAAVHARHADIVQLLLASGANVGKTVDGGYSALMLAAKNGDRRVARLLIANKANVDCGAVSSGNIPDARISSRKLPMPSYSSSSLLRSS
ncbi:ankyrin repeat-containing domain protein [Dactylonectria macrodidyma]|uniref:Ankyrin repeat-containing domain protein n=1 Tax=Dactylonectria macrodidyma TaxID=307937 RepID=A0A9P9IF44_9HYPO|nr:ankyrin repeat-containing domain protein [Dactylonectria macrodidyma]